MVNSCLASHQAGFNRPGFGAHDTPWIILAMTSGKFSCVIRLISPAGADING